MLKRRLMFRHVFGDMNAVARTCAVVAVVDEQSEDGDDHDRAAEDKCEDRHPAVAAGTVGHLFAPHEVTPEQTGPAARGFRACPPRIRGFAGMTIFIDP